MGKSFLKISTTYTKCFEETLAVCNKKGKCFSIASRTKKVTKRNLILIHDFVWKFSFCSMCCSWYLKDMSVAPKPRKKKLLCICYIAFITLLLEAYKIWPRCTKHCSITECQWTLFHYSSFHYATIGQVTKMLHLFCLWRRLYTWYFLQSFLFL